MQLFLSWAVSGSLLKFKLIRKLAVKNFSCSSFRWKLSSSILSRSRANSSAVSPSESLAILADQNLWKNSKAIRGASKVEPPEISLSALRHSSSKPFVLVNLYATLNNWASLRLLSNLAKSFSSVRSGLKRLLTVSVKNWVDGEKGPCTGSKIAHANRKL